MELCNWAEKEIELACKRENPNYGTDNEEWDYGVFCYQSALKAYKSLLDGGHSGMSWDLTVSVLNRLLHNQPLTQITDEDFYYEDNVYREAEEDLASRGLKSSIQCPRMSSLFKEETLDGVIKYHDVDRYYCFNLDNPDCTYSGGQAAQIVDELFPITMPYAPSSKKYVFVCDELGYNEELCDTEMRAYYYVIKPNNEVQYINQFYKKVPDGKPVTTVVGSPTYIDVDGEEVASEYHSFTYQPSKWIAISAEEFYNRKAELQNVSIEEE